MEINEILSNLCYYDNRNPNCIMDDEELIDLKEATKRRDLLILQKLKSKGVRITEYKSTCSCDNCFYGRTKLAEELIKLKNI